MKLVLTPTLTLRSKKQINEYIDKIAEHFAVPLLSFS